MATSSAPSLYLFYGNQVEKITAARDKVLAERVPAELRNENITEFYPSTAGDTVKLGELFDQIAGDLETLSFIPEAAKCAVITNPVEAYSSSGGRGGGRKPKKAGGGDRMLQWLERRLPETGNLILILAFEDESGGREINIKAPSPLFALAQKIGMVRGFTDVRASFRIEDAIAQRNLDQFLMAVADLWKAGKGDSSVYAAVVRALRFHLQANIARERRLESEPAAAERLLPPDPQRNLLKAHEMVRRKYRQPTYRTAELITAYERVLDVYRALRPRPGDDYVADARGLLERAMVELMGSRPPGR